MITIKKPIWLGGKIHVGLAEYRIDQEGYIVEMEILYTNKEGQRVFPNTFSIPFTECYKYPRQAPKYSNIWLRIIPLSAFKELKDEKNAVKTENQP